MGTINVTLGDDTQLNLVLGQQLENEVNEVVFDFSAWKTDYGSGDIDLSVQRHGDEMPYPVVLTVSGTDATWEITDIDTGRKGVGEAQVTYTVSDVVKKSVVYKFTVYRSLGENGEYPAPGSTWVDQVEQDIADIKQDLAELEGGGVPTNVRQALKTLLESAAYADTGLTDEMAVVSSWASAVTAITLNQSSISISGATTSQLTATTTPSGGTVTWSSSDTAVATVSSSGLVTGVSNGTATITATSGNVSATCSVTVSGIATLSSIIAVYTQGGTVYDTDSLDSLKTDLVVTATYSDSSTSTVASTDYTLSGTLTAGTSTITVTYSGKTTTFNVTVTHAVPSTDPVITDYDKYLNNNGTPTSGTGCCCTDYYDMLGTSLVIFTPWTEETYPRSSLNVVSYSGTTKTHYWNGMSTQSAPKSVSLSAAAEDSDKLRFSLFTSGLSSCYAYDSDSGDIYFAGEDSPYYGMSNISEAG